MSKQKYPQSNTTTATAGGHRLKTEGYCSDTLHAKRDSRRIAAQERAAAHAALTPAAKLAKANSRRGASARETERLTGVPLHTCAEARAQFNLKPLPKKP